MFLANAVHAKVIRVDISGQVALDPAAFIVVGAAALSLEITPDFETIEKKGTHIVRIRSKFLISS